MDGLWSKVDSWEIDVKTDDVIFLDVNKRVLGRKDINEVIRDYIEKEDLNDKMEANQ